MINQEKQIKEIKCCKIKQFIALINYLFLISET